MDLLQQASAHDLAVKAALFTDCEVGDCYVSTLWLKELAALRFLIENSQGSRVSGLRFLM